MSDTAEPTERIGQLRELAAEDPAAVSVEKLVELVTPADSEGRREIAAALDDKVVADPSVAPAVIESVEPLLEHETNDVRTVAATVLEQLAARHPERAAPATDLLAELGHDDSPFARRHALWALAHISEADPERVAPVVPSLRVAADEPAYFEHEHVITMLRNVAQTDPGAVTAHVPALLELLENIDRLDDQSEAAQAPGQGMSATADDFKDPIDGPLTAAELLATVAEAEPAHLLPYVDELTALFDEVHREPVRRSVVTALSGLADYDPDATAVAVPSLADQLGSPGDALRVHAAQALGFLAETVPGEVAEAVTPSVAELEPLLREGTPQVQATVAGLLSYVAEEDPAAVDPVIDALIDCLDAEDLLVRTSAALALGYAGGEKSQAALAELLQDDDLEPELRDAVGRFDLDD